MKVAATIPASGQSSRMGAPKSLLTLKGKTLVTWQIESLSQGGITDIYVVGNDELKDHISKPALHINSKGKAKQMLDSIRIGIQNCAIDIDGLLILPSDQPLMIESIVTALLNGFRKSPSKIIIPSFQHKKGHPIIIPSRLFKEVLHSPSTQGLKGIIQDHTSDIEYIRWPDDSILKNLNTPEEFLRFTQELR